jgi:putative membrane protein
MPSVPAVLSLVSGLAVFAQATEEATHSGFLPDTFWPGLFATLVFGLVGIALVVLGFKVFDWITPIIDVERELAEKSNMAVAIVTASIILGLCYIVAHVVK